MHEHYTAEEAIRDLRESASKDWRRAEQVEDESHELALQLRQKAMRERDQAERLERDSEYREKMIAEWNASEAEPAVEPADAESEPQIDTYSLSDGRVVASGYGDLSPAMLMRAAGYYVRPPWRVPAPVAVPRATERMGRPRERRPIARRAAARAPGSDDPDPEPSPLNRALAPAHELDAPTLRVAIRILLIRLRWLKRGGGA